MFAFCLLAGVAAARTPRRPRLRRMMAWNAEQLVDDYNSDIPTRGSMALMREAGVPRYVEEESDDGTNSYARCRPFVIMRRQLQTLVARYVDKALRDLQYGGYDNAALAKAMQHTDGNGKIGQNDDDDDDMLIGVQQPGIKSGTEILAQEKPMEALISKHMKLSQPERMRLHLRAKPKVPLCQNTVVLV